MAIATGLALIVAVKKGVTYGTDVGAALGALNGFRPWSWSVERDGEVIHDNSFNGDAHRRQCGLVGRRNISGKMGFPVQYEGNQQLIIAGALGTAGTPSGPVSLGYTHSHYRKNDMTGIHFVLAVYDGVETWTADSVKFTDVSFKATPGGLVMCEVSWIARDFISATATNPNLTSVTEPSTVDYVQWLVSATTFQLAAQGGTLAAFEVNEWDWSFKRTYPNDARAWSSTFGETRREVAAGEAEVTFNCQIPYAARTRLDSVRAATIEEVLLAISPSATKGFKIGNPSMKWTKGDGFNPVDKSEIPLKLSGVADKALSVPTGFLASVGVVPYVQFINTVATDIFA